MLPDTLECDETMSERASESSRERRTRRENPARLAMAARGGTPEPATLCSSLPPADAPSPRPCFALNFLQPGPMQGLCKPSSWRMNAMDLWVLLHQLSFAMR